MQETGSTILMKKPKFLTNTIKGALFTGGLVLLAGTAQAANFTTVASQGAGLNWTAAIWNPGPTAPAAGNTYECVANGTAFGNSTGNTRLRNPAAAGVQTFPGDSLTLNATTEIRAKTSGAILNFPGVNGNPGLILNGGVLNTGDDAIFEFTGKIHVPADSLISSGDNGAGAIKPLRGFKFNASLSGSGALYIIQAGMGIPAMEVVSTDNAFSGNWIVKAGFLKGSAPGSLGTGNIVIDPGVTVPGTLVNATLATGPAKCELMYDLDSPGALVLLNGGQLVLHQNLTFTGVTIEGTVLDIGEYLYEDLIAYYPNNFPAGGSGRITVVPPPPPASVSVLGRDTAVDLQWSPVAAAANYQVKRADVSGGPYEVINTVSGTNTYTDTGLVNGQVYYYVISSINATGSEGADSQEVIGRPNNMVTGFSAAVDGAQVVLNWDLFGGATSYTLKRATVSGGPYSTVASAIAGTTLTDTTTGNGHFYYYAVFADLPGGVQSGISAEVSALTIPGAPALTASLLASTVAKLVWATADTADAEFVIEASVDGQDYTALATVPGTERAYMATGLSPAATYAFRVKASNDTGESGYSNVGTVIMPAFGINVNFANTAFATNFPGYVNDYGAVFGDQGNGFSYGWDADNSGNARERNNINSADKRYDTLTHLQKQTPSRVWEVEVPNGFYLVQIVGGDPTATDSVFQFNVEGINTATYTPSSGAWWCNLTTTVIVDDGRLSVTSGPSASNNKINFINIYQALPVPIAISQEPQPQEAYQSRPLILSVGVTNAPIPTDSPFYGVEPVRYQWFFNDIPVEGGTSKTLTLPHAKLEDAGSYFVVVSNYAGVVTSRTVAVSVSADTVPPAMVSAGSLDGYSVWVLFSEAMDTNEYNLTTDPLNYQVVDSEGNTYQVSEAILRADLSAVKLVLDPNSGTLPIQGKITVFATTLSDLAGRSADGAEASGSVGMSVNVNFANTSFATNFPGYANDYGAVFGDRGNGLSYGWDFDNTANARERNNAASADKRYDTFTHLQKQTPSLVWEVEVPNGVYTVHVVSGDPTATDSVFQYNIENVITGTYVPTSGAWWGHFTNTVIVDDGRLTLTSGPSASNNKIDFIDISTVLQVPVTIVRDPQTQTVPQYQPATLTVTVTNAETTSYPFTAEPVYYQWFKNNEPLPGATGKTLSIASAQPEDTGDYYVVVSNFVGTAASQVAIVTVEPDLTEVKLIDPHFLADGAFSFSLDTVQGRTYVVEFKNAFEETSWQELTTLNGDGTAKQVLDSAPAASMRFYRVRIE